MEELLPTVLYKFLRPEHAREMVDVGRIRIGTLFDFRRMEGADPQRGDAGEGQLVLHSSPGRRVYNSTAELPPVLRSMSINCGPGGIATDGKTAVSIVDRGRDLFVYCTSERWDQSALDEWGGACVRISNPVELFTAVGAALRSKAAADRLEVRWAEWGRCRYMDRVHDWHTPLPPSWLLKPARFLHQIEYRIAWPVEGSPPLTPLFVQSAEIAANCEFEYLP